MNTAVRCVVAGVMLVVLACGAQSQRSPVAPAGATPVLPDLSKASSSIQTQIRDEYASLQAVQQDPRATAEARGQALGRVGMLLMAGDYRDAAEPFLVDAQTRMPRDVRWPYYLGHLYRLKNDVPGAVRAFTRVLELKPDDVPALVWLADVQLLQDRASDAEALLARALRLQPGLAAASYRLGHAALARRDYARAVSYLEDTLRADPRATIAHYPLAMAYRGVGNVKQAEAHLQQRGDVEVAFDDPLMRQMRASLASALSFETLGVQAMERKDWAEAAAAFRKGLDAEPDNPSLRHRLGTVLAMRGDNAGARQQFEETIRRHPDFAKARYSLGLMLSTAGEPARALEEFSAAVRADPAYMEARFEWAIALARVGRYAESRDRLAEGIKAYPGEPLFVHALARLLAASPDDRVRDGRRAVELAVALQQRSKSAEIFETLAMGLAAAGQYDQAVTLQRQVVASAERAGRADLVPRLTANLALYERHRPSRTPWGAREPVAATLAVH